MPSLPGDHEAEVWAYLSVVWVGVTIFFHSSEDWGWPHAALAAIVPTIPVGAGIIVALGIIVTPFALVWMGVQAVLDRLR